MKLVVVPCGRSKIWSKYPHLGPTPARDAYTGAPFHVNREFAEKMSDRWIILSAKYGFIDPDTPIQHYEVTFKRKSTNPVSVTALRKQAIDMGLFDFSKVIVLGGTEYRKVVAEAFAGADVRLEFPFAGLPLGQAMQAAKRAIGSQIDALKCT
jgi:cytoplasmic iron level regulating protein YaaA (DUF328/UPF0246 family)